MDKKLIIKNTTYLTAAFIGQKILAFIYFIFIARILGAENVGDYTVALSFTTIFAIFIDLGTSPVITREIAKSTDKISNYLSTIISTKLILSIITYASAIGVSYILGYSSIIKQLILLSGIIMVIDSFVLTIYSSLRGLQNLKTEAIGIVINQVVAISVGVFGLIYITKDPKVLMIAYISGGSINLLFALFTIWKKYSIKLKINFSFTEIKALYLMSIPFALSGIFTRVYSYIDSIILQKFLGSSSVGIYTVAYKIPFALQFIPGAFAAAIYPAMSSFYKNDTKKLEKVWYLSTLYLLLLAAPMLWGIYNLSDIIILTFYGNSYFDSIQILQYLVLGLVFLFLNFPLGSLLAATDNQKINTYLIGVTMIINIVTNVILIKKFGINGAAIAFLISHGFLFISSLYYSSKIISLNLNKLFINSVKIIISTFIMGLFVIYLKSIDLWVLSIPVAIFVYFGLMFSFKVIKISEIKELLQRKNSKLES